MPEIEEPIEEKITKKPKKKKQPTEPDIKLVYQDPSGNKLYKKKEAVGFSYTAFDSSGVPLSEKVVKQMMGEAGVASKGLEQTPFQLQQPGFQPQKQTITVPIYQAQFPYFTLASGMKAPSQRYTPQPSKRYMQKKRKKKV